MNKTLFVQILIVLAIVGAYLFIDFDKVYKYFEKEVEYTTQESSCDLHKTSCSVKVNNHNYTFEVFPKDIPLMKNIRFQLRTDDKDFEQKSVNIYATNMFMGYFYLKFNKISAGVYEAVGTLPTCPVGNMKWNADIVLEDNLGSRFQFQTTR